MRSASSARCRRAHRDIDYLTAHIWPLNWGWVDGKDLAGTWDAGSAKVADYLAAHAGWAQIREEERRAVAADGNAALVPTLDVGLNDDLHPPNKLPIGLRLAMAAEGEMPLPTHVAKLGEGYAVFMEGIGGRLHTWSGDRVLGVELCAETQASCRYAEAVATLNGLLVADDGKPATRIRYAWSDAPVVNLSDGRGVPIPGFELPVAR